MQSRTCSKSMLKLIFLHIQAHLNAFLQILDYFSQSVEVGGLNLLAYNVFELFDGAGCIFYTLPFNRPQKRSRQALDQLPLVSNFLTNFWMPHFHGARLSPNSVRNAVWHALNEPVCQYLRTRNPRCSIVYIDNCLGPLATESPCTSYHHCHRLSSSRHLLLNVLRRGVRHNAGRGSGGALGRRFSVRQ